MRKTKFDPRKLMELAVEVMKQSVAEPRTDDKQPPLVGAVIWKPDGTVETAYRGEMRDGDHAEYGLLERKNANQKLDGAKLFATLEPCAPGSRHPPKLGCSERIILARIKEVWIGIEDPDPKVDGEGIKYLEKNGVAVHMFDRDLQEAIQEANRDPLDKALERAAAAEEERKKPKATILSKVDREASTAAMRDLSVEALERYRVVAKIDEAVDSTAFQRRLVQQGVLKEEAERILPTGFGLLLFGTEPRVVMPQAGVLGTIHYSDGREETRDFGGPMVLIPEEVDKWLNDKLPNVLDRSRMRHEQRPEVPPALVREAVVNALVHRDYEITGAKCQLVVTPETITVMSPGGPVQPITLAQLQDFSAPMLSRNPQLQYVFARMQLANERGLGMKTLRSLPPVHGLPLPKYSWEEPYLVLTLYRSRASAELAMDPGVLATLSRAERAGWQWLATKESISSGDYATAMKVPNRTALNHLKHFTERGLIERVAAGPATRYRVMRK